MLWRKKKGWNAVSAAKEKIRKLPTKDNGASFNVIPWVGIDEDKQEREPRRRDPRLVGSRAPERMQIQALVHRVNSYVLWHQSVKPVNDCKMVYFEILRLTIFLLLNVWNLYLFSVPHLFETCTAGLRTWIEQTKKNLLSSCQLLFFCNWFFYCADSSPR